MKTNGNDPASPSSGMSLRLGLTKRELFAAMAMQGMCSDPKCKLVDEEVAPIAVKLADLLIAELNKEAK